MQLVNDPTSAEDIRLIHLRISEIQNILTDFRVKEDEIKISRKSLYQEWAQHIERLMELGDMQIFKHDICSIIAKNMRLRHATDYEIQYLYECLPYEYKNSLELSTTRSTGEHNKRLVEESRAISKETFSNAQKLLEVVEKQADHFTADQHKDLFYVLDKIRNKQEKNCDNRGLTVLADKVGNSNDDNVDSWTGQSSKFDETFHVEPSSEPGPSRTYYKVKEAGETLIRYSENVWTFKPKTDEQDIKWAEAWEAFIRLFDPATDQKWKRSWRQWHEILNNRIEYSLHGSMSMSKLETKIKGVFRAVTREQIDAKMIVGFKFFKQLTNLPMIMAMLEHVESCMVPDVNELSDRMHEKLSNSS